MPTAPHWHYPRPELAARFLAQFEAQPSPALTLFAARRIGKTTFLRNDLMPAAAAAGYLPLYIDFWESVGDAVGALTNALQCALDEIESDRSPLKRLLETPISSLSWFNVEMSFGSTTAREPEQPLLRIRWLLTKLIAAAKRPILIIADEYQQVALDADGEKLSASLRSSLQQLYPSVKIIFSGSSESRLSRMLRRTRAPLYNFSTKLTFPRLDRGFVQYVIEQHLKTTGQMLDEADMVRAYRALGDQPGALIEVATLCRQHRSTNVNHYARQLCEARQAEADSEIVELLSDLRRLDYELLCAIAHRIAPTAKATRAHIAKATAVSVVYPNSITHAINKLHDRELITTWTDGTYRIADDELWRYLVRHHPNHPLSTGADTHHEHPIKA